MSKARVLCTESAYPPALLAVAGYRLPAHGRHLPHRPLDGATWAAVLAGARTHRITGPLHAATADGALPATPAQAQSARLAHRAAQMRVMALEPELLAVVALLGGEEIDCRVLKGSAVARLDYPDPALRSFVDLDVLVRPTDIDRAAGALAAAGFARTLAEPRPGFDRRFDKGMTLISPSGFELDLHRTFVLGPWGAVMDLAELWDGGEEFTIGRRRLRALSAPARFMHACYHAALGDWPLRLGSLRDVAQMLDRAERDRTPIHRIARSWRAEAVLAAAVADCHRLLGLSPAGPLTEWARDYRPDRRERAWLALHTHPDKTFAAQALATLRTLPGWRDKASYLRALTAPDPRYVAGRHASNFARFRHALREIRRGRGARA